MVLYDNLKGMSAAHTDEKGRFAVNVLAGEVRQVLLRTPRKFSRWTRVTQTAPIVIPAGATTFDLPPIEIAEQPGPVGRLVDRAIRPVSEARVTIVSEGHTIQPELSDEDGAFSLQLPDALPKFNINNIEKIQVRLPDQEAPLPATLLEGSMPFILQLDR